MASLGRIWIFQSAAAFDAHLAGAEVTEKHDMGEKVAVLNGQSTARWPQDVEVYEPESRQLATARRMAVHDFNDSVHEARVNVLHVRITRDGAAGSLTAGYVI